MITTMSIVEEKRGKVGGGGWWLEVLEAVSRRSYLAAGSKVDPIRPESPRDVREWLLIMG